jgi:hypothetical protein
MQGAEAKHDEQAADTEAQPLLSPVQEGIPLHAEPHREEHGEDGDALAVEPYLQHIVGQRVEGAREGMGGHPVELPGPPEPELAWNGFLGGVLLIIADLRVKREQAEG